MKDRKKPAIRFKGFTEDWEQRKLGELALFNPKDELPQIFEYVDLESVVGTEMLSHRTEIKSSAPSRAQRIARTGDLFYQTVRPYQKNNYLFEKPDNNYVFSTGYAQMRPFVDGYFMLSLVQSERFIKVVLDNCTGTSYPAINSNNLAEIEVHAPSNKKEDNKIGTIFRNIDNLITLHQCKLKLLKQIKQSMQNGLFIKNTTKNRKELENMTFKYESDFEETLINLLSNKGWEKDVIKYPTESELLQNWANILFDNNRGIDRLNNYPLTEGEMQQVLEQINSLRTPIKLNEFINGKTVSIKRDNPDDLEHLGKEISLKIYDRREIAAGQSRYQIVQQPVFPSKTKILNDRRGDLMLLINGMPVIHIELKKSGVPVSQACNQIEKYSKEGIFTGLFSLVQVFVAMTPNETRYFANPGPDGRFNSDYYFKWADFNNEPINDWKEIASSLLSIPMAHQLIGFYTIADESDGILKVMRSYQYYAANAISDKVAKIKWDESNQRGGFIWHTTGSGKNHSLVWK